MSAPSNNNILISGLSFCERDTFSKHYNISYFVLSILTMSAPSNNNILISGLSFCERDTFSKHYNISYFVPVRMPP